MKIYKNGILFYNWLLVYDTIYKVENIEGYNLKKHIFQIRLKKLKETEIKNVYDTIKTITLFKYNYE
jgi:hypothetical protein